MHTTARGFVMQADNAAAAAPPTAAFFPGLVPVVADDGVPGVEGKGGGAADGGGGT